MSKTQIIKQVDIIKVLLLLLLLTLKKTKKKNQLPGCNKWNVAKVPKFAYLLSGNIVNLLVQTHALKRGLGTRSSAGHKVTIHSVFPHSRLQ